LITAHELSQHPISYTGPLLTGAGPFPIGEAFRAEDAVVTVTGVDKLSGLSAQDLGSVNHGIQNLVTPADAQVQVTLNIVNYGTQAVTVSTDHIGLRIAGKAAIKPMSSTLPKGRLGAGLSIEGEFGFVAPRNGSTLQLEMPGAHGPVLVDLGTIDTSTSHDAGGHHH
jgi:hypothetical protein